MTFVVEGSNGAADDFIAVRCFVIRAETQG